MPQHGMHSLAQHSMVRTAQHSKACSVTNLFLGSNIPDIALASEMHLKDTETGAPHTLSHSLCEITQACNLASALSVKEALAFVTKLCTKDLTEQSMIADCCPLCYYCGEECISKYNMD